MRAVHRETHLVSRIGWLRAAVLGANDGIVSTASLIVGVAASASDHTAIILSGVAGLVAGAMSMAAGEYVSVNSQADTEKADLDRERRELAHDFEAETAELARIYVDRGLQSKLAEEVARQLMAKDATVAHARDELGVSEISTARPLQAAFTSAATFAVGAMVPLVAAVLSPPQHVAIVVSIAALISLTSLGAMGARAGGAGLARAALRVGFWGALAMAVTAGVGTLFGATVG